MARLYCTVNAAKEAGYSVRHFRKIVALLGIKAVMFHSKDGNQSVKAFYTIEMIEAVKNESLRKISKSRTESVLLA